LILTSSTIWLVVPLLSTFISLTYIKGVNIFYIVYFVDWISCSFLFSFSLSFVFNNFFLSSPQYRIDCVLRTQTLCFLPVSQRNQFHSRLHLLHWGPSALIITVFSTLKWCALCRLLSVVIAIKYIFFL
jgi:hypothetical protein